MQKVISREIINISQRILQISFTQIFFSISLRNICLPSHLHKKNAVPWAANRYVGLKTPKHSAFYRIDENFENLNSISPRNTRFLSFDGLSHHLYLFKKEPAYGPLKKNTDRHSCDLGNVSHSTSRLLKRDLVQTLNTFQDPSLQIFAAREGSLVYDIESIWWVIKFFRSLISWRCNIIRVTLTVIRRVSF